MLVFRVGLQYLDCRIATLLNHDQKTLSRYFPENFPNIFICVEKIALKIT